MMKSVIKDHKAPIWIPRSFSWGFSHLGASGEISQIEANDAFGGADLGGLMLHHVTMCRNFQAKIKKTTKFGADNFSAIYAWPGAD